MMNCNTLSIISFGAAIGATHGLSGTKIQGQNLKGNKGIRLIELPKTRLAKLCHLPCQAEVTNFEHAVGVDEKVSGLDVPVHDFG